MLLTVLGAYLPRLSPERLASWVSADVQNFVEGIRELRGRGLARYWTEDVLAARAAELPDELTSELGSAALFEILVQDHKGEFDPYSISEKQSTAVAWEPAYLSLDGERLIGEQLDVSSVSSFRVAFYIIDWPEGGILLGPSGVLAAPDFEPVPERLWELAPYAQVD